LVVLRGHIDELLVFGRVEVVIKIVDGIDLVPVLDNLVVNMGCCRESG
jgi:hypothetical protein